MSEEYSESPDGDGLGDLQWFKRDYAHGTVVAAVRGKMAIKAVDRDDNGTLYPILVEPEELDLDGWEEATPENAPADAAEFVKEQHQIRRQNIAGVAGWDDG